VSHIVADVALAVSHMSLSRLSSLSLSLSSDRSGETETSRRCALSVRMTAFKPILTERVDGVKSFKRLFVPVHRISVLSELVQFQMIGRQPSIYQRHCFRVATAVKVQLVYNVASVG